MKLSYFNISDACSRNYYQAVVYEVGRDIVLDEYYTTKNEAMKAVIRYKKAYKGNYTLDCFVRQFDTDGCAIKTYTIY